MVLNDGGYGFRSVTVDSSRFRLNAVNERSPMIMKQSLLTVILALATMAVQAVSPDRILSADELVSRSESELAGELIIFESVGEGIALSLAVCADNVSCQPALSEPELAKLIETLDSRIQHLRSLAPDAQSVNDRDSLLSDYQQTRQQYALYMRELRDIKAADTLDAEIEAEARSSRSETADTVTPSAPAISAEVQQPAPPKPKFRNEGIELEAFEDADELIRSD